MDILKVAFGIILFFCVANTSQAQPGLNLKEYGLESTFPQPPNSEKATAVVNYNLDFMDFNPGENLIHYDEATQIKLYAFYVRETKSYSLKAVDAKNKKKEFPVRVTPSDEQPTCVFANIGPDWVNVLCSEHMKYKADPTKRDIPPARPETATDAANNGKDKNKDGTPKVKKEKKKKKKKNDAY